MDIMYTFVSQINLIRFDELPFFRVMSQVGRERLVAAFRFTDLAQPNAEQPVIVFRFGTLEIDKREISLPRLHIEPRKIVLDVEGTSSDAAAAYEAVVEELATLADATSDRFMEPVLQAYETVVVSQLNFQATQLINPVLTEVANGMLQDAQAHGSATAVLTPSSVRFEVDYLMEDRVLSQYRIALNRKELTIGPRKGYPLTEQIYESQAPVDLDAHLEMLQNLEEAFAVS